MRPQSFLPFGCLLVLIVAGWWLPNRPRLADLPMPADRFNAVSFAPFRAGQSPLAGRFPSRAEVEADVALVAPRVRALRTYAANEGDYDVAEIASRHGLKVWQGIWLGADRAANEREIAKGIALANAYPETVERVIVGNEVLLRRDLPTVELTRNIDRVRAAVHQPVTYADVWEFWEQFPEVAAHVDLVTIHLLPYWEDVPFGVDRAIAHLAAVHDRIQAEFPGKPVAIGETGWPSRGRWRADAAPGRIEQVRFLRGFVARAQEKGWDYCLIEAFDQVWKYQNEGTVGANWGLWRADRTPKFPLHGSVAADPDWGWAAAASCLFAILLLASAPVAVRRRPQLQALAAALGAALGFAWAGTEPTRYDMALRIAGAGNLAGQAALAVLMMQRAATPPHERGSRTGADATRAVRDLSRLRLPPRAAWFDDLGFVFVWTAAVMQVLLVVDPRYRDFPFPVFAVPLTVTLARAAMRDLPRGGGGRAEWAAGLVLAGGAVASAIVEGPLNLQAQLWSVCALVLAGPPLLRLRAVARAAAPA